MTNNHLGREHRLGPNAIEIEDPVFTSAFVAIGSNVYFDQPSQGGDGLVVLGRAAALKLAHAILDNLESRSRATQPERDEK